MVGAGGVPNKVSTRPNKLNKFMMREKQHARRIDVRLIPTKDNGADMFTKVLDNKTFAFHRAHVMNLPAK